MMIDKPGRSSQSEGRPGAHAANICVMMQHPGVL
jgi:hypothetical protein